MNQNVTIKSETSLPSEPQVRSSEWLYCPSCMAKTLKVTNNGLICEGGQACEASENKTLFSLDYVRGYWKGYDEAKRAV